VRQRRGILNVGNGFADPDAFNAGNGDNVAGFGAGRYLALTDPVLMLECLRAYNDWLSDWASAAPNRFIPQMAAPIWDVDACIAELHRTAAKGARAVSFSENPVPLGLPSYWNSYWDPIWRACEERDIPLCLHIGTSGEIPNPSPDSGPALGFAVMQVGSVLSSVNLMMSPVCRLFPRLKFVFSEGGIGWLPNALERADRMWVRHGYYSKFEGALPSEIFRQNMYLCMIEEPICLKYRDDIGIDKIMWECDYPHTDTVWPSSQASAQAVFDEAKCSPAEIEAITHGNAERVFNWQMAAADLATV